MRKKGEIESGVKGIKGPERKEMEPKEAKRILIFNIGRIIKDKGLKQCAVAEKAGFSPRLFSSMLNERKFILAEYIPNIATALGVEVNELYRKEG